MLDATNRTNGVFPCIAAAFYRALAAPSRVAPVPGSGLAAERCDGARNNRSYEAGDRAAAVRSRGSAVRNRMGGENNRSDAVPKGGPPLRKWGEGAGTKSRRRIAPAAAVSCSIG